MAASLVVGEIPDLLERQLELWRCSSGLNRWRFGRESEVREDAHDAVFETGTPSGLAFSDALRLVLRSA